MTNMFNNLIDYKTLVGETIKKIEVIKAEFGRTYKYYICILCESGKRILMHGGEPYEPDPNQTEMENNLWFFTPDEVGNKIKLINKKRKQNEEDAQKRKKREYEKLKRELEL